MAIVMLYAATAIPTTARGSWAAAGMYPRRIMHGAFGTCLAAALDVTLTAELALYDCFR